MGMQGRGKARGRRYVALLMSLLLMMAAWQTLAVAAEGDADLEAVAVEEVVPEADAADEAEADEEAVPEQDVQIEELQEPAESDQVEEEIATEVAAPESEAEGQAEQNDADDLPDAALQVQSSEDELSFANGAIWVRDLSAGEVTYDEASNTLTLNAATMGYLELNTSVTIELVGENTVVESLTSEAPGITITINGEGSLVHDGVFCPGAVYDPVGENHQFTGAAIVNGGTVDCDFQCKSLTVNGGTVAGYVDVEDLTISAGSLIGTVNAGSWYDEEISDYRYSGTVTMAGGAIKGDVYCKDFFITSGTIDGAVWCECDVELANEGITIRELLANDVTISAGTVTSGVIAGRENDAVYNSFEDYTYTGTVTMTGGTVKGGIQAENVNLKGGYASGRITCMAFRMYEGAKFYAKDDGESGSPINCSTFAIWGGSITLVDYPEGIVAYEKASIAGGTITVKSSSEADWDAAAIQTDYTFYMKGGTINTSNFPRAVSAGTATVAGGTIKGAVAADTVTMSKGAITGNVDCSGTMKLSGGTITYVGKGRSTDDVVGVNAATLSMTGGTIKVSKCNEGISVSKSFVMSKGTVTIAGCNCGIQALQSTKGKTANITLKGGKVTITDPYYTGIEASYGNITMTGGTVSVTGSYRNAVCAYGTTYRGTKYGGRINITGGKLTAKVRKPSTSAALNADYGVSNNAACLVAIVGRVDKGTSFKVGGNTYKVSDYSDVRLTKYESSKTSTTLTTVKFGSKNYSVVGVATNAFATTQGKKLKSLSFGYTATYLGSDAFKGTSSLTSLRLQLCTTEKWTGTTCKVSKMKGHGSYAKTAFRGAGKNSGKGLTVRCGSGDARTAYRAYLRTLGLPSGAKVIGYRD